MSEINYSEHGSGKPVVLLHGFCESGAMWDDLVNQLSRQYRLLVPDLPGFGQSPLPEGDFSIDDIGQMVMQWLEELNIAKSAIIGHSLGGYVALAMAKQKPSGLKGLGLFHSTAFEDTEDKKDSRNKTIDFIKNYGPQVFAESFAPSLFYAGNKNEVKDDVQKIVAIAREVSEDTLINYTRAMRDRQDRTDVLRSFEKPILFIAGEFDTAVPLDKVEQQIHLPKNPIVHVLKDTGHMGIFERKEQSLKILEDFLQQTS